MKARMVAIASDHAGVEMKEMLKAELGTLGYEAIDLGTQGGASVDYPDYAHALAEWVEKHEGSKGVLICGSGIGMSIAANRHKGIRAALVHNGEEAALARGHNDANVLCLGARLIGSDAAKDVLKIFLATEFEGGRHEKRVEKLG
ncbi:MAG: ribose 5-phosphate isomerase B [Pseudomonadota bacterium]|nr:ribose 5-phosphate isomerase B [Pseudomonadota bacterium]